MAKVTYITDEQYAWLVSDGDVVISGIKKCGRIFPVKTKENESINVRVQSNWVDYCGGKTHIVKNEEIKRT